MTTLVPKTKVTVTVGEMVVERVRRVVAVRDRVRVRRSVSVTRAWSVRASVRVPVSVPVTMTGTVEVKRSC